MRRGHYLARETVFGLPLVALVLNAVVLGVAVVQLRASKGALKVVVGERDIAAAAALVGDRQGGGGIPVLLISAERLPQIDGRQMDTPIDLEFRLAALSSAGTAIRIRAEEGASSDRLTEAMAACARAGFTHVMVETVAAGGAGKAARPAGVAGEAWNSGVAGAGAVKGGR